MRLNLFSFTLLTKYLFSITLYAFLVFPMQNANAIDLNMDNLETKKTESNFSFDKSLIKISSLVFKETDVSDVFKLFRKNYLTFYSTKNEKIDANYSQGAYFINYTSHW